MSKKKKQNRNGGKGGEDKSESGDDAQRYSRDAFMTNPPASATDFTGFAQRVPETASEADALTDMFKLPNGVTEKKAAH